jgi:hypothetical protein
VPRRGRLRQSRPERSADFDIPARKWGIGIFTVSLNAPRLRPGESLPDGQAGVRVMPRYYFLIYLSWRTAGSRSGVRNFVATAALV